MGRGSKLEGSGFLFGWVTDDEVTYAEALARFQSMTVWAVWDGGERVQLIKHEIRPYSPAERFTYICDWTLSD